MAKSRIRKSKLKRAINKSLAIYYQNGFTNVANKFKKELWKNIIKQSSKK